MTNNNNSLSNNYVVSLLRSMIVLITITLCVLGSFVDGNPTNNFTIWMYFLAVAPIIFIFTLFIKKFTNLSLIILFLTLIIFSLIFNQSLFYRLDEISSYKISLLLLHFLLINYFFWKGSRTLLIEDVGDDLSLFNKVESTGNSRKLVRRSNRRGQSRAKNSTNIRSGQYRG